MDEEPELDEKLVLIETISLWWYVLGMLFFLSTISFSLEWISPIASVESTNITTQYFQEICVILSWVVSIIFLVIAVMCFALGYDFKKSKKSSRERSIVLSSIILVLYVLVVPFLLFLSIVDFSFFELFKFSVILIVASFIVDIRIFMLLTDDKVKDFFRSL